MDASLIGKLRLANHLLAGSELKTPREVVSWMGAIQAQDFNMGKWAVGSRLPGISDREVEDAVNKGEIIRSHILRPTWHFVSRDDIHWMLELSAPRLKATGRTYDKMIGLTEDITTRAHKLLRNILEKEPNQTRQELGEKFVEAGISINASILNHIMFNAEQAGLVCNGVVRGKKQTYDLLERKVPKTEVFDKDEALRKLAYKYFRSHGPATLQDFIWWSGLTAGDSKKALEMIRPDFIFETVGDSTYIFHSSCLDHQIEDHLVHFLPAFDELFVSYKDRKEVLATDHHKKVIVSNGVFKPTIFYNGQVIGIWNRIVKKNQVISEPSCFSEPNKKMLKLIDKAAQEFNNYMKG
ncbi:winged helix DNA-binding domain-containing protein [Dysgonomonas sp. OttesenSCG-928-D17]|nr:winged helix DNA-binding domain-containing protein [Dysgonomonas sp. OttesenSCG-928-D17]